MTECLPTNEEINSAVNAMTAIAQSITNNGALKINGDSDESISFVAANSSSIIEVLGNISHSEMVKFVPYSARLTTQQAADI